MRILDLRNHLSRFGDSRIISDCAGMMLRTGPRESISVGDTVVVFPPSQKQRKAGYRVIAIASSHAVIEFGKKMTKQLLEWIRMRRLRGEIIPTSEDIVIVPRSPDKRIEINRTRHYPSDQTELPLPFPIKPQFPGLLQWCSRYNPILSQVHIKTHA